jgi:hypothetical protein
MGFELYLQCFASGRPAGIPRAAVRALFPVVEEESEPDYWRVRYDLTNTCTISVTAPLVASESVVADLPQELVDSMGQPRCMRSAQEILDIIRSTYCKSLVG